MASNALIKPDLQTRMECVAVTKILKFSLPVALLLSSGLVLTGCGGDDEAATAKGTDAGGQTAGGQTPVTSVAPTELTTVTLQPGSGESMAKDGDIITMHYTGWLFDGTAEENKGASFDSSRKRGRPFAFTLGLGQVIGGWEQGVAGMKKGEQRRLTIPPQLGYGDRGVPGVIPAGSTLIFDVELVEITPQG